jgi:hypothetical protein
VSTSLVSSKSGCDIPCRGVPHTGHVSAFKVISAPQHAQKAATLSNLHNCYSPLDERRKCKDSRRRRPAQSVEDREKEDQESVGCITDPPESGSGLRSFGQRAEFGGSDYVLFQQVERCGEKNQILHEKGNVLSHCRESAGRCRPTVRHERNDSGRPDEVAPCPQSPKDS